VSAQNHYSLLHREVEKDVLPACERFQVGLLPFFPLASGMLTGKYRRGEPIPEGTRLAGNSNPARWLNERNFSLIENLESFARERGLTLLQIAIGYLLARPQVASVIAGATRPEQVIANVEAGQWEPTPDELDEIERIAGSLEL
jgi:aryl-alcohol dehydrogenase-like predicted oxidoreductase